MAFTTPNTFTANTAALASEVNENFAAIAAELNEFPTDGAIKAAAIDTTQIKDKAVTKDKLADALLVTETETIASNDNDNTVPTCAAVVGHVSTQVAALVSGGAKAWVTFNAAGTVLASFNVTSVTKNSTGNYTITWDTNFGSTNYVVVCSSDKESGGSQPITAYEVSKAAGTYRIQYIIYTGTAKDPAGTLNVVAFGDQ